jgi:undecaprenyl-diphosphatase
MNTPALGEMHMMKLITVFLCIVASVALSQAPEAGQMIMTLTQAAILGLVEGVTEYLPVSSTGHLILVDRWLGLRGNGAFTQDQIDAVEAFEIVIQSGAIIAVLYAYVDKVKIMIAGLLQKNPVGKKLFINVVAAFIPAMVIGFFLHKIIKAHLQQEWPTVFALALGGIAMIVWDRSELARKRRHYGISVENLAVVDAIKIGLLQCIAMWPGTSRSMMTILGGQWVGLSPVAAAEFSFLLGLPTLMAATAFKALKDGHHLANYIGFDAMAVGLVVAAISAFVCVKGLIAWLSRHGLQPFGWYRLVLAAVVAWQLSQ